MQPLDLQAVQDYVNENVGVFHQGRLSAVEGLTLRKLLDKNPYLFRAKNLLTASDVVASWLEAFLSSSEEEHFGQFLEGLAVFVAEQTSGGHKSTAKGVDLEFAREGTYYVVSIKSGTRWGNASQWNDLAQDLRDAVIRVRQSARPVNIQPVLGICYGKTRTVHMRRRGFLKVVGQNFWYLISESKSLYTEIIEPIGYRAKEHNDAYGEAKASQVNRLTKAFIDTYCNDAGAINWPKLVEACCGNYDLDKFL